LGAPGRRPDGQLRLLIDLLVGAWRTSQARGAWPAAAWRSPADGHDREPYGAACLACGVLVTPSAGSSERRSQRGGLHMEIADKMPMTDIVAIILTETTTHRVRGGADASPRRPGA